MFFPLKPPKYRSVIVFRCGIFSLCEVICLIRTRVSVPRVFVFFIYFNIYKLRHLVCSKTGEKQLDSWRTGSQRTFCL